MVRKCIGPFHINIHHKKNSQFTFESKERDLPEDHINLNIWKKLKKYGLKFPLQIILDSWDGCNNISMSNDNVRMSLKKL